MEFLKLELPSSEYNIEQSIQDKKQAGSFANQFYTVIRQYRYDNPVNYASYGKESLSTKNNACESINKYYDKIRCNIDLEMQKFIHERNGKIDSWPDSSDGVTTFKEIYPFLFDYFKDEYTVSKSGEIHRKSDQLIYQNHYHFPNTEEYNSLQDEKEKLKCNVKKAKEKGDGRFVSFISLLVAIYLLYGIFLIVSQILLHLGDKIFEFICEINGTAAILSSIPYTIYYYVIESSSDSRNFMIGCTILLLAFCLFGVLYFLSIYNTCKDNAKERKQAKKALNTFLNSDHYKQVTSENEKLRKLNEEMAEQWHKAWFEWICKVKG
ncbi:MAG: hypothetical protein ACI4U3_09195 [Traorella sp.]